MYIIGRSREERAKLDFGKVLSEKLDQAVGDGEEGKNGQQAAVGGLNEKNSPPQAAAGGLEIPSSDLRAQVQAAAIMTLKASGMGRGVSDPDKTPTKKPSITTGEEKRKKNNRIIDETNAKAFDDLQAQFHEREARSARPHTK